MTRDEAEGGSLACFGSLRVDGNPADPDAVRDRTKPFLGKGASFPASPQCPFANGFAALKRT